ncbi:MAG: tyrosine-type recombinase/integrase [Bacteroidales bacterium]|nr:tyrosine-type recombinase/integrase [Bacteroidales bacterium]
MSQYSKQGSNRNLAEYIPAQISNKKIVRVFYYAKDPLTGELRRVVVKCNRPRLKRDRLAMARQLCAAINERLRRGWNPFVEEMKESGGVCFEMALQWYMGEKEQELRPDSLRCYRSYVRVLRQWLEGEGYWQSPVCLWQLSHTERFMAAAGSGIANKTYNGYVSFYRSLWNWFVEQGYAVENPFDRVKTKRVDTKFRDVIPPEVRDQIRDYLLGRGDTGFYQVCQLCYRMLIRPKEILMLRVEDVRGDIIRIRPEVAKNHNEREAAIPEDLRGWFGCLKGVPGSHYIFSKGYRPGKVLLSSRDIGRSWSNMRKALGFSDRYTFYSLKDTGITEMLERGVPAKLVKELADHSSLEMTERYTHRSNAHAILKYDVLKF